MRILMLNNEFPPLGGGMGTVNQALFHQFAIVPDLHIDLITSGLDGRKEKEQFSDRIWIYKVPVWNKNIHHSTNRELIFYSIQSLWLARDLHRKKGYKLSFAWSGLPAGAVALALNKLDKLPYMVRVSGPDIPGFERRYNRLYPLLVPIIRSVWRSARPLIAKCSHEVDMIRLVEPDLPVLLIPNCVDIDDFRSKEYTLENSSIKVICVARLIERKGQRHLIEAVKNLVDNGVQIEVNFVGAGDALDDYQKLTRDLRVTKQIKFLGYIPREKIPDYYSKADVFVLPSYNEGMSLAMLEAMASGLALVVTRTGGTDNLVRDGLNGFTFDWGDINQLTAHLDRLAKDRQLLRQMGIESRRYAEHFTWQSVARQYHDLFTRITNNPGNPFPGDLI